MIKDRNRLADYDNVLVTDEQGNIVFYDLADMNVLQQMGVTPDDFFHRNFLHNYEALDEETSSIYQVLKHKKPVHMENQLLQTKTGFTFYSTNSTYPIFDGGECIGTLEFSRHTFEPADIALLHQHAAHKLYRDNQTVYCFDDIVGHSEPLLRQIGRAKNSAKTDSAIMISGASGTGKEMFAQSIHNESERFTKPYRVLNCGMLTAENIDAILYGSPQQKGLLAEVNEGTLLLDHIHLLEKPLQPKLLHALELRELTVDGHTFPLNIRFISTTSRKPDELLASDTLDAPLYYRLNVVQVDLPKLSNRKEDILPIVEKYIAFFNDRMTKKITGIEDEVKQLFLMYDWPGNVRELKNAIENAYNEPHEGVITWEHIPARIWHIKEAKQPIGEYTGTLKDLTEQYEKTLIADKLKQTNGRLAESARQLGISRQLLKYKCAKYEIR